MSTYTIFGIDPGNNGAAVVLKRWEDSWDLTRCFRLGNGEAAIAQFVKQEVGNCSTPPECYLERVTGFGGGIGLKLRENYGFLRGVLTANGVRIHDVQPQAWMKAMGVEGKSQTAEKRQSMRALAAEIQDDVEATNWNAAAVLIAFYGAKQTEVYENNELAR